MIIKNFLFLFIFLLSANVVLGQSTPPENSAQATLSINVSSVSVETPEKLFQWFPPPVESSYVPNPIYFTKTKTVTNLIINPIYSIGSPAIIDTPSMVSTEILPNYSLNRNNRLFLNNYSIIGISSPQIFNKAFFELLIARKAPSENINTNNTNDNINVTTYRFFYGEPITYFILFKSLKDPQRFYNSTMFIQLPSWVKYKPGSIKIDGKYSSDQFDEDSTTYVKEDSMILVNFGDLNQSDYLLVQFEAQTYIEIVPSDKTFCLIKMQNTQTKLLTEWIKMPILVNKSLNPIFRDVIMSNFSN